MFIALLNASARYRNNPGILNQMAGAVSYQMRMHVAPAWLVLPWQCRYYEDERQVPAGAYRLCIFDSSDQAGALGYHGQDPNGNAYGRVFVNPVISRGGTDLVGPRSVSMIVSHEACEMMMNPEINSWRQMRDGRLAVQELCDAVQGDFYNINMGGQQVSVSNFLLPSWFDYAPAAGSKFDYLGKLSAPFTISRGGYMMVMGSGRISNIFGSLEAEQEFLQDSGKAHEAARGFKIRQSFGDGQFNQSVERVYITQVVEKVVEVKPKEVVTKVEDSVKKVTLTDKVKNSISRLTSGRLG